MIKFEYNYIYYKIVILCNNINRKKILAVESA